MSDINLARMILVGGGFALALAASVFAQWWVIEKVRLFPTLFSSIGLAIFFYGVSLMRR